MCVCVCVCVCVWVCYHCVFSLSRRAFFIITRNMALDSRANIIRVLKRTLILLGYNIIIQIIKIDYNNLGYY